MRIPDTSKSYLQVRKSVYFLCMMHIRAKRYSESKRGPNTKYPHANPLKRIGIRMVEMAQDHIKTYVCVITHANLRF